MPQLTRQEIHAKLDVVRRQQETAFKKLQEHMKLHKDPTVNTHQLMKEYQALCGKNDALDRELGEAIMREHKAQEEKAQQKKASPLDKVAFHLFGHGAPPREVLRHAMPRDEPRRHAAAAAPRDEPRRHAAAAAPRKEERGDMHGGHNPMRSSSHPPKELHCRNFNRPGGCSFGSNCKYKHVSPCKYFKTTGCTYGVMCKYSHQL
jgi:hypothetical protein